MEEAALNIKQALAGEMNDEGPAINSFDALPNEIVEIILLEAIKIPGKRCNTYNNLLRTCSRFQLEKGRKPTSPWNLCQHGWKGDSKVFQI